MLGSDDGGERLALLFRDRIPVCWISSRFFNDVHGTCVCLTVCGSDDEYESSLTFRHLIGLAEWEIKELVDQLRDLLQFDRPLRFRNIGDTVLIEVPQSERMADEFAMRLALYGSCRTVTRGEKGEILTHGVVLTLRHFTATRESLTLFREALQNGLHGEYED